MYKSIKTAKYILGLNFFPKTRKKVSKVYHTGIRLWESDDFKTYSIVLGGFRILFNIKKLTPTSNRCCGH